MRNYKICRDISKSIFRAYDIRGIVDDSLTIDGVYTIALAIGSQAREQKQKDIIIGCDGRLSSPDFLDALSFGLQETGCNVINLGEITSPMLYYAISKMDPKSGVMITGSHNPASYNGLKVIIDNVRISEDSILNLYERIKEGNFVQGRGTEENTDIINEYIDFIVSCVSLKRHLKVVLDCANGVGSKTAPKVFKALGCEVIELFCEVDGTFPNHHPDPLVEENMQDLILEVQKQKADVGFAFDGDADRVGVVSSAGEIIWPDRQMILFVRDILSRASLLSPSNLNVRQGVVLDALTKPNPSEKSTRIPSIVFIFASLNTASFKNL